MFSSTELIRKSKMIFDKLHKKDIEKAIILRDGKPSFMLLDFSVYEKMMAEYLSFKELSDNHEAKIDSSQNTRTIKNTPTLDKLEDEEDSEFDEAEQIDEINLEEALAQIDNLDLEDFSDNINEKNKDNEKDEKELLKRSFGNSINIIVKPLEFFLMILLCKFYSKLSFK